MEKVVLRYECHIKLVFFSDFLRPFLCPTENCGRTYKYRSGVLDHLRYECNKPKEFHCPEADCSYAAHFKSNLKKHIMSRHKRNYRNLL